MDYVVVGYLVVAAFLTLFTLLALGGLALQVLGLTGRVRPREQAEAERREESRSP